MTDALSKEPAKVFYVERESFGGLVSYHPAKAEEMRQHIYETVTRERETFTATVDGTSAWMPFYDWFEREFGDD